MTTKRYRISQTFTQSLNPQTNKDKNTRQSIAKDLIKNRKFIYIDINEQSCYRDMNECESEDEDDQMQSIGKHYKINLNDLQSPNFKAINFLQKMKETNRKKEKALNMVKQELKRSTEKIRMIKPEDYSATRYVVGKNLSNRSTNTTFFKKTATPQPKENKLFSLLSTSMVKQLTHSSPKYSTIQSTRQGNEKNSPEKRTERYLQKLKSILPSINQARRTIAF